MNRFIALCFPHRYKVLASRRVNRLSIAANWAFCVTAIVSYHFGFRENRLSVSRLGQCTPAGPVGRFNYLGVMMTYLPFSIVGLGVVLIVWKSVAFRCTKKSAVNEQGLGSVEDKVMFRRLKMAKKLLVTFVWSALCSAPNFVIVTQFPQLTKHNPSLTLWVKTCLSMQFAFAPVRLL